MIDFEAAVFDVLDPQGSSLREVRAVLRGVVPADEIEGVLVYLESRERARAERRQRQRDGKWYRVWIPVR
jgi:hypothetical protein